MAYTLVIDSGHGGPDSGATAKHGSLVYKEKDLAWKLATTIRSLSNDKMKVVIVPHGQGFDSPDRSRFINRVKWAKAQKPDLFLSVHLNSFSPAATGVESWFKKTDEKRSSPWAVLVAKRVSAVLGLRYRGAFNDKANRHGSLGILTGHTCASALLETCFVSNKNDVQKLIENLDKVAEAIFHAAYEFIEQSA